MNILIINPIPYTSETEHIKRAGSIKDTMIYGLASAFVREGHNVTLFMAESYKITGEEDYPFKVIWAPCKLARIFKVHRIPYMPELSKYIRQNIDQIDMIISGEIFALHTLAAVRLGKGKTIIWHELAKHNNLMHKIPSKIWYNIIARICMRNTLVIGRSEAAKEFASRYCHNVSETVIGHGIDLGKFAFCGEKEDYFVVVSQLIARKRIDGIIRAFSEYGNKSLSKLVIIGDGDKRKELEELAGSLSISDRVVFTGKLGHDKMLPYLQHAKAMLINTEKDNSMISIIESIACGTPVVSTPVPLNTPEIIEGSLGIIAEKISSKQLADIDRDNSSYVENCRLYRDKLSNEAKVREFIKVFTNR
ncbi:glycosyltransferase [Butyrivibrio sp. MC2013]|uniref:glycosyltransferase n=1 Tax=Butyrivibrio sp. MC2013 TaxID=1280686 RepID=UPI00047CB5D5|nr:glycosyltransferase [Butyrivibrio sp. MC2013]